MRNRLLLATGIILFLAIVAGPSFYNLVMGKEGMGPQLQLPSGEKECVEDRLTMRARHVDMLNDWKERVVRNGERNYKARSGKTYVMSLTGTCFKCHTDKAKFCDRCHDYAGVRTPYCWDCHNVPSRKNGIAQSARKAVDGEK